MERFSAELLTEKELRSAKELLKGNFLLGMESTDNRMTGLAKNEICFGRHMTPEEIIETDRCGRAGGDPLPCPRMFRSERHDDRRDRSGFRRGSGVLGMIEELPVSISRLPGTEDLPLPCYMTQQAAGMDLFAAVGEDVTILPGKGS